LNLIEVNAALDQRIGALERQVSLNSMTSSRPPSSDGLKKPPAQKRTQSLRGKSNRKSGGQPGHKGKTLRQSATPDRVINHYPKVCDACGSALMTSTAEKVTVRQVVDLPAPPPSEVTEHRVHQCRCGQCDAVTRGVFPEGVRGQCNTALGSPVSPAPCRPIIASQRNASSLCCLIYLVSQPFQPPWRGLLGAQLIAFNPS
jgi:transposase